jgi:hypothetical protein
MCEPSALPAKWERYSEPERKLAEQIISRWQNLGAHMAVLEVRLHPNRPPEVFQVRREQLSH